MLIKEKFDVYVPKRGQKVSKLNSWHVSCSQLYGMKLLTMFYSCPHFFAKQLTLSQPRGLGNKIWTFENKRTFKKCCWLHSFLAMEAESRNQKDIWNCWPCFSPAPIFCQTVNPISTKGTWTPNFMFWKWKHIQKILLAAFLLLPWRLKVEIKRIYEIADQALALHSFFLPNS